MRTLKTTVALSALLAFGSCSETEALANSSDLQARIDILNECFPELYEKLDFILQVAKTWNLNDNTNPPDPAGLVWMERPDGSLQVDWPFTAVCALDMQITFFNEGAVQQDIDLAGANSLSEVLDIAGNALATTAPPRGFIVADWSLRDPANGIAGAGSLTAIIGGTANGNELERIFTSLGSSTSQGQGGPPVASVATISTFNAANVLCVMRVDMPNLETDTDPTQQYPNGVITFTISTGLLGTGALEVVATVTFDKTNMATVDVTDVPTSFTLNLDTFEIN